MQAKSIYLNLILWLTLLPACTNASLPTTAAPTLTLPGDVLPTTTLVVSQAPLPIPTLTATPPLIPATTPSATIALVGSATFTPIPPVTAVPLAAEDAFWADLQAKNYRLLFSGSLSGPAKFVYSAYGFVDTALEPVEFNPNLTAEACRLAVYRSDGTTNTLLQTFGAPQFPKSSRYHGFPVICELVNWDTPAHFYISDETKQLINAHQYASDINGNALPEFALFTWYCPNACDGDEGTLHFYEVQDTATVVHITDNLPGAINPWDILHSA